MSHIVETIPPGHPLQSSLEAIFARRRLPKTALATLRGSLDRATLSAAPGAPAVPLSGPLFLAHASAAPADGGMSVLAVVSWSDHGLPRMLAGQLDDAISAGVQVWLPGAASATSTTSSAGTTASTASLDGVPDVSAADVPPWEAPVEPTPPATRNAPRKEKAERPRRRSRGEESPHVDLSAEMAALTPNPALTPAPAAPAPAASGGGWAAAVAASQAPQRPAASRAAASPSDLGFDIDGDPDLVRGDVLLHPRFGRCKVIKTADDKVKVRRPTGAFIDLHLKVCRFARLPDEDGKRVFELRIGRK